MAKNTKTSSRMGLNMKYTKLGKTGITVSRICLGMMSFGNSQEWQLEIDEARPIVERALDAGINFFDTANVYSRGRSEEITGELLKDVRDDVVIATKIRFAMGDGHNDKGLNRYHMAREIENSLNRLKTDFIDLYQIHRWDASVDPEFLMRSLNQLIDGGYVLHIGASSMYTWQLAKLQFTAERLGLEKFATMQNHYNAIYREEEREMIPFCMDQGMGIIPWSPLARGFLSGKYSPKDKEKEEHTRLKSDPYLKARYFRDNDFQVLEVIKEIAQEKDVTPAQVSLSWILHKPGITSPIVGVTKMEHLEQAIDAIEMKLTHDELKRIEEAYLPHPIIGHSYEPSDAMVDLSKNK